MWTEQRWWIPAIACVLGFTMAGIVRADYVSYAQVYSDSMSPFAAATKVLHTGWSDPPNPESDHWLWITALPLVFVADDLETLLTLRFWTGALVVPFAMAILWLLGKPHQWLAMILGAVLLVWDSGLIDTSVSAFRGYLAPEFIALATVGFALWVRGHRWGGCLACVATVVASGHHPLALGCLLSTVWLLAQMAKQSWSWFLISVFASALACLPRVLWIVQLLQCDAGGLQCLQNVSLSSAETLSVVSVAWDIVHDRLWIEMGVGGIALIVGCFLGRKEPLKTWTALQITGVVLLGLSISTLRPYHFRIVAVPLLCWSLCGWMRVGRRGWLLLPIWVYGVLWQSPSPLTTRATVQDHDEVADFLCALPDPFWVDGNFSSTGGLSLQGIGVSMGLQGCAKQIVATPADRLVVVSDVALPFEMMGESGGGLIYQIPTASEMRQLDDSKRVSGFDVATLFYPDTEIQLRW